MKSWKRKSRQGKGLAGVTARVAVFVLELFLLAGCLGGKYLPGHPGARMILPASKAWVGVNVLPDGRRVVFEPEGDDVRLSLLDVVTGEEVLVSTEISWVRWLDDELLYGRSDAHCVIDLQTLSVVRLESLSLDSETLPQRLQEAGSVYVTPGQRDYLLLIVERGPSADVVRGYAVGGVRDPEALLTGIPHKVSLPALPYNSGGEKYPSPDGRYYYMCNRPELQLYSQQGELLNSIRVDNNLTCFGWAWDSTGVYFQERMVGISMQIGPLELLPVRP